MMTVLCFREHGGKENTKKAFTLTILSSERGRADWMKVNAVTEAEIEAQSLEDGEELIVWTLEMLARAKAKKALKQLVSARLDPDVLEGL